MNPIKPMKMTENEIKLSDLADFCNFFQKMADSENMKGVCFTGLFSTQIDAEYAIFIEKSSLFLIKVKILLIMADFQRFQEKWLILKIDEGINFRKQFSDKQMHNIQLLLRNEKHLGESQKLADSG